MLLRTLLQLSLMPSGVPLSHQVLPQLEAASEQEWQDLCIDLERHRLMPLIFYGLKIHGLTEAIPPTVLNLLMRTYVYSLGRNQVLLKTLAIALKGTDAMGIRPILWKGVVLADQLYPDPATRMMGDIDWAIAPHELATVTPLFEQLGFVIQPRMTTPDAVYFMNQSRIFFDVHHRVRLFEGKEHLDLTQNLTFTDEAFPLVCALSPTAMLTHLTVHMTGHLSETGPMLFWILDIVFLLRKWGDRIDWALLNQLMPDAENWMFLGRVLRFLEVELKESLPPRLAAFAQDYKPLTLELILRQSRLAVWGLPYPKGWLRLMACRLGIQPLAKHDYPQASDLFLWPTDGVVGTQR